MEKRGLSEDDHNARLDLAVLQRLDPHDAEGAERYARVLREGIAVLARRNRRLARRIARMADIDLDVGPIAPDLWRRYKKLRRLGRRLAAQGRGGWPENRATRGGNQSP